MTVKVSAPDFPSPIARENASSTIASVRRASAVDRCLAMAFEVECRPLAALEPIAAAWRDLAVHAAEPNIFYEPAFALAAAPVLGSDVFAGLVWSSSAPRQLLGLFPVGIDRRRYGVPVPLLVGWTHPYAPLGTPLVRRELAEPVIAAWLDHVARDPDLPDLMLMPLVSDDGPFAAALASALTRNGCEARPFDRHQRAVLAPGGERAGYVDASIGPKRRKELRRQKRLLQDTGDVQWSEAKDASGIAGALEDFLALEASGWKGRAGTAAARNKNIRRFMTRAVVQLGGEGKAAVHRLLVDERPVAAIIMLNSDNVFWCWKIAYDEAFARYSPGVLLTLIATEALLAEPTLAYADSCATAGHPMIDHIWRERRTLADQLICTRPDAAFSFALVSRIEALRRTTLSAAKSLRSHWRR